MSGFGWGSPFPAEFGGGQSDVEQIWQALRDVLGKTPRGTPVAAAEDSLEDLWRQAEARAIAFSSAAIQRATLQVFPDRATDWLPYYEWLLAAVPEAGATIAERQEEVARRFAREIRADGQNFVAALQAIESTATVLATDTDLTVTAQSGFAFNARPYSGAFGTNNASNFPAYSTEMLVTVQIELESGVTELPALTLIALKAECNEMLPAWVDFAVAQLGAGASPGFFLDGFNDSLLDLTAFA